MRNKIIYIGLVLMSVLMVTLQHHAKEVRDIVNPEPEIPVLTVNINQASANQIAEVLIGIGVSKANLIVSYRDTHGPFKSLEALTEVKGIGAKTIEKNRAKIIL